MKKIKIVSSRKLGVLLHKKEAASTKSSIKTSIYTCLYKIPTSIVKITAPCLTNKETVYICACKNTSKFVKLCTLLHRREAVNTHAYTQRFPQCSKLLHPSYKKEAVNIHANKSPASIAKIAAPSSKNKKLSTSKSTQNTHHNLSNSLHPTLKKETVSILFYRKHPPAICQIRCTLLQKQEAVSILFYRKHPTTICQIRCNLL